MRAGTIILSLFLATGQSGIGQDADSYGDLTKQEVIKKWMAQAKAKELVRQILYKTVEQYRALRPDVPAEKWNEMQREAESNLDELMDSTVDVYDRYFSREEILQLLQFYESPVAQKFIALQPIIVEETSSIGAEWGRELERKLTRDRSSASTNRLYGPIQTNDTEIYDD